MLIAGPNGSGKTTCARLLLPKGMAFVNADLIAQQMSGEAGAAGDLRAGRVLVDRLDEIEADRLDFAIETTLATKKLLPRIARLRADGYETHLIFLWLPNGTLAVQRVAARVRAGGHDVPEETVRRRYASGLRLFFSEYSKVVDTWRMYDNSRIAAPRLIAYGVAGKGVVAAQPKLWQAIRKVWVHA